jgi:hypothetical protein
MTIYDIAATKSKMKNAPEACAKDPSGRGLSCILVDCRGLSWIGEGGGEGGCEGGADSREVLL